ncbi:gamma carbonic anhydrase family protein [Leucobacter sp. CSA1]|uniref:Gamma carbonic anhydrase family protein n=1 Tax=Leucobacter chromiisoli TaxID=2796471 RepID=A0A934Q8Q8_9MICO|nr:transferase hexapeptide repeat family protein [Leucobacter chromiisoli]MBK0420299.1 gamma carbonic anhydrase family protein [Leucobacter chromiisoli]
MTCYEIDGVVPVVEPTAFVHETASLIGDVIVGAGCYIGPHASLRADLGRIVVGEGSNVQDSCTVHVFPGRDTELAANSHVGHGAVLHGCSIGSYALIGINAAVLDDAVIGADSLVGAGAVVTAGSRFPPRSLVLGSPARLVRELDAETVEWKRNGTRVYHDLVRRSRATLRPATPLPEIEPDRRRVIEADEAVHLTLQEFRTRRRSATDGTTGVVPRL